MIASVRAATSSRFAHRVSPLAIRLSAKGDLAAGTSRLYNLPADYWDKYPERITAITKEQVQAAAQKYLDPGHLQIVAVGDGKKIGESLKKFGPVEVYNTEGKKIGQ